MWHDIYLVSYCDRQAEVGCMLVRAAMHTVVTIFPRIRKLAIFKPTNGVGLAVLPSACPSVDV
jgi:hypothetical protein